MIITTVNLLYVKNIVLATSNNIRFITPRAVKPAALNNHTIFGIEGSILPHPTVTLIESFRHTVSPLLPNVV